MRPDTMLVDYENELSFIDTFIEYMIYALQEERVSGTITKVFRGPATVSVSLKVLPTPGESIMRSIDKASTPKMVEAIRVTAGVDFLRAVRNSGGVTYEFPALSSVTPGLDYMRQFVKPRLVPIGMDAVNGDPYYLHVNKQPNVAWVGPPGSGKSEAMVSALWAAVMSGSGNNYPGHVVLTKKPRKWAMFAHTPGCLGVYNDTDHIHIILREVAANISDTKDSPLIVVLDDVQLLLKDNPKLAESISMLVSAGRGQHTYIWIGTQIMGTSGGAGGFDVENNVTARIVYRPTSAQMAYFATGNSSSGAMSLTGAPGDCIVVDRGGNTTRIATPYITKTCASYLPRIDTPVDQKLDWYRRFYAALSRAQGMAEQAEQDQQVLEQITRKRGNKEQQLLACAKYLTQLEEPRLLEQDEVDTIVNHLWRNDKDWDVVSKRTLVEFLFGGWSGNYKKLFDESMGMT